MIYKPCIMTRDPCATIYKPWVTIRDSYSLFSGKYCMKRKSCPIIREFPRGCADFRV